MQLDIKEIMQLIPQRYPFLLVDRIEKVVEENGKIEVVGYKNISINEPFFQGHFPDEPIMPGVLILESMGQVGAVALRLLPEFKNKNVSAYLTTINRAKFRKPVKPGDQLRTTAKFKRRVRNMGKFDFAATVDGEIVAEAEMGFVISSGLTIE